MRRKIIIGSLLSVLVLLALATYWIMRPATRFNEPSRYLYLPTGKTNFASLMKTLRDSQYISSPAAFQFVANRMDLASKLKPGRYEITKGMNVIDLVRMLRNGTQAPVNLVITKLRTKENLAALAGKKLECDSAQIMAFLNNNDSLASYGFDSNTVMTAVFPNSYRYFWNSNPSVLFRKLKAEHDIVWNKERRQLADTLKLTPEQVYILASIVEEETRLQKEKPDMASVYLNRFRMGMPLQADPTVKFALRNFGLRRIYEKHLAVESPYNTYRVKGLPPGPICTPSLQTLDAVLNPNPTKYLFFVANSDFSGSHVFSETYQEHLKNRRAFQEAQNRQEKIRKANEDIGTQP